MFRPAQDGWSSWEIDIDAETGNGRTLFVRLGSEWGVWSALAGLTFVAAVGEHAGGTVTRRVVELARRIPALKGTRDARLVDV